MSCEKSQIRGRSHSLRIVNESWVESQICGCFILFHFIFFARSLCVSFILPTCLAVPLVYFLVTPFITIILTHQLFMLPFLIDDRDHSILLYIFLLKMCEIFCITQHFFQIELIEFLLQEKKAAQRWGRKVGSINGGRHIYCLLLPKTNKN